MLAFYRDLLTYPAIFAIENIIVYSHDTQGINVNRDYKKMMPLIAFILYLYLYPFTPFGTKGRTISGL